MAKLMLQEIEYIFLYTFDKWQNQDLNPGSNSKV